MYIWKNVLQYQRVSHAADIVLCGLIVNRTTCIHTFVRTEKIVLGAVHIMVLPATAPDRETEEETDYLEGVLLLIVWGL